MNVFEKIGECKKQFMKAWKMYPDLIYLTEDEFDELISLDRVLDPDRFMGMRIELGEKMRCSFNHTVIL